MLFILERSILKFHPKSRQVKVVTAHSDADGVQNWPDCIARKLMETE